MGAAKVTTQNLEVVRTDADRGLIMIKGAVPGSKGGWVTIKDAVKKKLPDGIPYPTVVKLAAASVEAPVAETALEGGEA
jgi:large subunit ribosomal protein L3